MADKDAGGLDELDEQAVQEISLGLDRPVVAEVFGPEEMRALRVLVQEVRKRCGSDDTDSADKGRGS
jgi:hypothetical protein